MKKRILVIVCAVMLLGIALFCGSCHSNNFKNNDADDIIWSELILGEHLPMPENPFGEVSVNLYHALSMTLYDFNNEQFETYKQSCIDAGFTVESEFSKTTYIAFNNNGYQVRLIFNRDELYINLNAPEKLEEFTWPTSGLGSMLPATTSLLGDISWNNSETFIVHVGNTTIEAFAEYIEKCENLGFTVGYSKDDKYYSAKNAEGYKVTLRYLGFNNIEIALKAPEGGNTNNNSSTITGIRKEFKEAMDSYEAFFDEYIAFMKKYNDSDNFDLNLINDYTEFISKYADFTEKFAKWGNEDLNAEETAYYIQVQNRVNKKILELSK